MIRNPNDRRRRGRARGDNKNENTHYNETKIPPLEGQNRPDEPLSPSEESFFQRFKNEFYTMFGIKPKEPKFFDELDREPASRFDNNVRSDRPNFPDESVKRDRPSFKNEPSKDNRPPFDEKPLKTNDPKMEEEPTRVDRPRIEEDKPLPSWEKYRTPKSRFTEFKEKLDGFYDKLFHKRDVSDQSFDSKDSYESYKEEHLKDQYDEPDTYGKPRKSFYASRPSQSEIQGEQTTSNREGGRFGAWISGGGRSSDSDGRHPRPLSLFRKRQKPRSFLVSVALTTMAFVFLLMFIGGVGGFGVVLGIANAYVDTTPVLDLAKIENQQQTSFIYDANGKLITTFTGLENRIWAKIDEVPAILQQAFVAIEDERFYTHPGIDLKRIFGAFFSNLTSDTTQGGSTITQQVIKLRLLSYEQTYKRKLQEAYLALQLETQYTKDQILETYINTINLGSGNYGVKAAAKDYFGKELSELTIRECAILASIARSSYLYNPRTNYYIRNKPEQIDTRTNTTLERMYRNGFISKEQMEVAKVEKVHVLEKSKKQQLYDMPYFLEYAVQDVVKHFLRERGLPNTSANRSSIENELRTSGYHIYTTVDPVIQHSVEESLYNWQKYPMTRYNSDSVKLVPNPDGSKMEIIQPQAAAAVFDYRTGQLKAIVGGREAPTAMKTLNRAALSKPMPVGSSIKPLAVYGPALNKGGSPGDVIMDVPLPIPGWNTKTGFPNNYGGNFSGAVTMREALRRSINVAAAKLLMYDVTIEDSYDTLLHLGVTSAINKDGSGLALGTTGISPIEMAAAFGAIGNKGMYREPVSFTRVVDSKGNVLLDTNKVPNKRQVFTPAASWLLVDMLTDAVKYGTGTRAKISGMTVAGKTGTNSKNIGVFFSGLTPYYSAAVWIGHDGYKSLHRGATGGHDAAPLWKDFMSDIHEKLELPNTDIIEDSPKDLGLVKRTICSVSGKLATAACELDPDHQPVKEWFQSGNVPTEACDMHREFTICSETNKIADQYCPTNHQQSIILIPPDSELNALPDEDFFPYFPNGIRNLPADFNQFNGANPQYAVYFCQVHTKEWFDNKVQYDKLVEQSKALLTRVSTLMEQHSTSLTPDVVTLIDNASTDLNNAVKTAQPYNAILAAYNHLYALNDTHLEPLASSVGEN